jgi:hypothetical protein
LQVIVLALEVLGTFDFYSLPADYYDNRAIARTVAAIAATGTGHTSSATAGAVAAAGSNGSNSSSASGTPAHLDMLRQVFDLVRGSVVNCVDDSDAAVRLAACVACCRLLDRAVATAEQCQNAVAAAAAAAAAGVPQLQQCPPRSGDANNSSSSSSSRGGKPLRKFTDSMTVNTDATAAISNAGTTAGTSADSHRASSAAPVTPLVHKQQYHQQLQVATAAAAAAVAGSVRQLPSSPRSLPARRVSKGLSIMAITTADLPKGGPWPLRQEPASVRATRLWAALRCGEVLDRLLTVGLADESSAVRAAVFGGLCRSRRLDPFVAAADTRCVLEAANDEAFEVRRSVIVVIARAARHQPGALAPFVRRAIVQLVNHLEVSQDAGHKRERALLLTDLVSHAGPIAKPYVRSILRPLLRELGVGHQYYSSGSGSDAHHHSKSSSASGSSRQLLSNGSSSRGSAGAAAAGGNAAGDEGGPQGCSGGVGASPVVTAALAAVGELALVSPEDVIPIINCAVLPAVVAALSDHTSLVKQVSVPQRYCCNIA